MSKEPKRMSEEPTLLGASITAVREGLPSEERLAALAARLNAAGASVEFEPTHQSPPAGEPPRAGLPRSRFFRPRLLALGALAVGVGFVAWRANLHSDSAPPSEGAAKPDAVAMPTSLATPPNTEPSVETGAAKSVAPQRQQPVADPNRAAPAPTVSNDAVPAPTASAAAPVVPPSAPSRAESPPSPSPAQEPPKAARRLARSSTSTPGSTDTPQGAPLAANTVVQSELELLKLARSAVAADPAQAYALTERCRAQYPSGDLAQEREYIAISALVRLGRASEASSRAALFRMHYPSSAYLPRLSRLLGDR